jgi:hypothetical protein
MRIIADGMIFTLTAKIVDEEAIKQLIRNKTSIKIRQDNGDDFQTFLSVIKIAAADPTLTAIDISRNKLRKDTLTAAEVLAQSSSLESINLSFNIMGATREEIANTLMLLPSLKHLIGVPLSKQYKQILSSRTPKPDHETEWIQVKVTDSEETLGDLWVEITCAIINEATEAEEWTKVEVPPIGDTCHSTQE